MEAIESDESDVEIPRSINCDQNTSTLISDSFLEVTVPKNDSVPEINSDENDSRPIFPSSKQKIAKKRKLSTTDLPKSSSVALASTPIMNYKHDGCASDYSPLSSLSLSIISSKLNEGETLDFGLKECSHFVNSEEIRNISSYGSFRRFSETYSSNKFCEMLNKSLDEMTFSKRISSKTVADYGIQINYKNSQKRRYSI